MITTLHYASKERETHSHSVSLTLQAILVSLIGNRIFRHNRRETYPFLQFYFKLFCSNKRPESYYICTPDFKAAPKDNRQLDVYQTTNHESTLSPSSYNLKSHQAEHWMVLEHNYQLYHRSPWKIVTLPQTMLYVRLTSYLMLRVFL